MVGAAGDLRARDQERPAWWVAARVRDPRRSARRNGSGSREPSTVSGDHALRRDDTLAGTPQTGRDTVMLVKPQPEQCGTLAVWPRGQDQDMRLPGRAVAAPPPPPGPHAVWTRGAALPGVRAAQAAASCALWAPAAVTGAWYGWPARTIAQHRCTSFRADAQRATLIGLPLLRSRW